jgi:hypothetical protein
MRLSRHALRPSSVAWRKTCRFVVPFQSCTKSCAFDAVTVAAASSPIITCRALVSESNRSDMRRSAQRLYKSPRHQHLAPDHETWHEKHDACVHLKRMGKLAGTGYYIPPAWYNHFRMFPPINKNFDEAKTENPHDAAEPTKLSREQLSEDYAERAQLRTELARQSRSAAAAGNRYLNQYWVRKPLDDMERAYYKLTRGSSLGHAEAVKEVVKQYRESQAVQTRVHLIQSEEAKLTGKFITMREAMAVLELASAAQQGRMDSQQYAQMARDAEDVYLNDPVYEAQVVRKQISSPKAAATDAASTGGSDPEAGAADAAAATAEEMDTQIVEEIILNRTSGDSLPKLRDLARGGTSEDDGEGWYGGYSPALESDTKSTTPTQ